MHNCFLRSSQDISIHASAREATIDFIKILDAPAISIHASAREATSPHVSSANNLPYFNPRLREGGDSVCRVAFYQVPDFNPRLREGGDTYAVLQIYLYLLFQSTPPRGRRRFWVQSSPCLLLYFNPRLREGGDLHATAAVWNTLHFNPRLREGGDPTLDGL